MVEVRWHGRGGQGAVTAAKLLALAALREGKHCQAFPEFGPERRGAPLQAFTRVDDDRIRLFTHVARPDAVVVLDETLVGATPLLDGVGEESFIVANYPRSPDELRRALDTDTGRIAVVGATEIALRNIGRPVTNTAMLGALLAVCPVVGAEAMEAEMRLALEGKVRPELLEANVLSFRQAWQGVVAE